MTTADPTAAIDSGAAAYGVAHKLLNAAGDDPDATIWRTCAAAPMAALLYSASPRAAGGGLPRVQEILDMPQDDALTAVVDTLAATPDPYMAYLQTAWTSATNMDPRQAASIQVVIRQAIAPYTCRPA